MSKNNNQKKKKIQIIEALSQCLLEHPFHETSIKDIARIAGVNHGVLHYYFKSKEDILLNFIDYMIEKYKQDAIEELNAHDLSKTSNKEILDEIVKFLYNKFTLNKDLSKIFIEIWGIANYNEKVRMKLQDLYNEWDEFLKSILLGAGVNEKIANVIGTTTIAFFEGLTLFAILLQQKDDQIPEVLETLKEQALILLGS